MRDDDLRNSPDMQLYFKAAKVAELGCIAFAFIAPVVLFVTIVF